MTMMRVVWSVACLLCCGGAMAEPLTLGEVVRRALAKGFDMELQGYDLAIARDNVANAKSEFDPQLAATAGKTVFRERADELLPGSRSVGINTNIGLSQRLATGADVGIGANLDRSQLNPSFAALNPAYASGLTMAVRQPLLKRFGAGINRAAIRSAEIGLDNAGRSFRSRALDVILSAEAAYYQLTGTREQLQVLRASLELAEKLLNEARSRRRAGMATKLDELQAQVGVSNAKRAVVEAENAVKSAEDELLALMGRFELDRTLGPAETQEAIPETSPEVEKSYELALQNQPELASARALLDLDKLDLSLAKDDLKPSLDLDLALGFNGDDASERSAFDRAFASERSSWQAGVTLRYPLGRVGEKARYRQARATLNRDQLALQQLEQDTLVRVRNAVRDVQTGMESVKLAAESADLSEKQHEYENARFRAGLSTSRRVLEAQVDLENARVAQVQAKLNLQTALANLRRIEGTGLDHYGIELAAR
jgi:outer membrane protein TolC